MLDKKVSIIIPTLDRQDKLNRIVDNLLIHSSLALEVIVVDDSRDSWDYIKTKTPHNEIIKYFHRGQKLGVSSARNLGSQYSAGEYLIFLDDDDAVTDSWAEDFQNCLINYPDLVFCNMRMVTPSGKISSVSAYKNNLGIVIPGAWMIRKEIFNLVGGYDERLKFAENTELFFRLDQLSLKKYYIEKENFIYNQSSDGGSKNLQNMLDSLRLILEKHDHLLSDQIMHLYHQNIGVIEMRFGRFDLARKHLIYSWSLNPRKISTLIRIALAYLPFIARKIYTLEIRPV
jgi:glycosyltransferase involved in cell wall biosynthesis